MKKKEKKYPKSTKNLQNYLPGNLVDENWVEINKADKKSIYI